MILYKLACKNDHSFDAWFRDSASCDDQISARQVVCPTCGSTSVSKALMAPRVAKGRGDAQEPEPSRRHQLTNDPQAVAHADLIKALRELRKHIETRCDYVGRRFPEEARKIHDGEVEHRDIHGEPSPDEARRLRDEGIEIYGIPWLPRHDS